MPVIGTAGHVDHGKSTLIHALTGIDPDRLREEKERGLTIDLGFAWLTLPSGLEVGVVDVPGHERFIKNMLAGAGGMDLALLVVAADEGPRPQTAEHLAILDLLEVPAGLVVLTKCDLVESDYVDLVEAELEETLRGSRLEAAPILRVSATTGAGLDQLRAAIDEALAVLPNRRDLGRPRVPVDRAFSIQGFGAVVTGTLTDGWLRVGDEMELLPAGLKCRVRGLQRHRTKVDAAGPGTRIAVNLSGVHHDEISRGMVLARPGALPAASSLVVRLTGSSILAHPLQHDAEVTLLSATAQSQAKVRLLDADSLGRGQSCWAQFVLDSPIAVLPRDHVVVRSPDETLGGGPVVALNGRRLRRHHTATLDALQLALSGTPQERILERLATGPLARVELGRALGIEEAELAGTLNELLARNEVERNGDRVLSAIWIAGMQNRVLDEIDGFMKTGVLRRAAPREHLRRAAGLAAAEFDLVVEKLVAAGSIEERGVGLSRSGYEPSLSPVQQAEADTFLRALRANPYSPPTDRLPAAPLLAYLVERGDVEDTGAGVVFVREAFTGMVDAVRSHLASHPTLSLAETRDLFGTSRKYAQAFLERLDALHITRRTGDQRSLR